MPRPSLATDAVASRRVILHRLYQRTRLTAGEWRALRAQAGLDQVHLGPMLGVRNDHLSRIERGHMPAGAVLERLFRVTCAIHVGASVEDLRALVLGAARD